MMTISTYTGKEPIQDYVDSLPLSRIMTLDKYLRDLTKMEEMLALFHDELILDQDYGDIAEIMYARIWLQQIYEGVHQAKQASEGLQKHLADIDMSTTYLAYKVKQANNQKAVAESDKL